ncbi:Aste57867_13352 [Aphanomyces stellatus]|uniref:Aste57867_13352 protein n=1 Tax=Aphanomyces stellatus TaxID=120398 RepID=A0A485KXW1_9STRA|nr:hypothetical protein As57867_013302 [Aphanomyces stellatus]VFT90191.1 Aste57867_13352 [Aphanomyces stellatus]
MIQSLLRKKALAPSRLRHLSSATSSSQKCVGVVREVYNKWERRAPLTPSHVQELVQAGVQVRVQPSTQRIFTDEQYEAAGAKVTDDLSPAKVIVGVKQVPIKNLLPEKTYMFFSHVIKAQPENMKLLDAILDKRIRMIDYECITKGGQRNGQRLIAFGGYAGRAGMLAGFRGLGERLINKGYSSPFVNIGSAYSYPNLTRAKEAIAAAGELIQKNGIPADLAPMTVVFTGNGNVSKGAQEMFKLLPHKMVDPSELPHLPPNRHVIYGCVVSEQHMVEHKNQDTFEKSDYYKHPENYSPVFHENIAPYTSLLVNCMYWDDRYPRLITKDQMDELTKRGGGEPKLQGVADISCDIGGSIEFLDRSTTIEDPFYLYDIKSRTSQSSLAGAPGVMMMGVDILPSELPTESSTHFGNHLVGFLKTLSAGDAAPLPVELEGAVIAKDGKLTPKYEYIGPMRMERERTKAHKYASDAAAVAGSTCVQLEGHMFDSGLLDNVLNLIESHNGGFSVIQCEVRPNFNDSESPTTSARVSRVIVQISMDTRADLDDIMKKIQGLAEVTPGAEALVRELPDFCKGVYDQTLGQLKQAEMPSAKDGAGMSFSGNITVHDAAEQKNIVCLGAGLVSSPLVEYLTRDPNHRLTIVSGLPGEANTMAQKFTKKNRSVVPVTVDVGKDQSSVASLVAGADCVVSLLPAPMHVNIAKTCLDSKTPLVTASYISPEMQALNSRAQAQGIPILCELGLDPGMDHMSAMKIIDEVQANNGRVVTFSSVCGGLPAPEAADNPIAYKFSWSPRGVLMAALNSAQYRKDGHVVQVKGEDLLSSAERVNFLPAFALEQIPNRDSLPYATIYNIPDAESIYRGTLRYAGNCAIMHQCRVLGLLNTTPETLPATWPELISKLKKGNKTLRPDAEAFFAWLGLDDPSLFVGASSSIDASMSDASSLVDPSATCTIDAFCSLLIKKLSYGPGERDMAIMHHEFGVQYPDRKELITSTYVGYGDEESTVMAKTVGMSAAIGVELILRGDVQSTGVLTPTTPDIYTPGLARLEAEGIRFIEKTRVVSK